jgi:uncharacterized RDD family membrane protein YckC
MKVANWKQRTLVFVIDFGILFLALLLLGSFFKDEQFHLAFNDLWIKIKSFNLQGEDVVLFFERLSTITAMLFTIGAIVIYFVYFIFLPMIWKKQTIGRWIAKVKVVKLNGSKLSFGTLLIREFLGKLFLGVMSFGIVWIISIIMMEIATVKRTIHDRMANTLMVNVNFEEQVDLK